MSNLFDQTPDRTALEMIAKARSVAFAYPNKPMLAHLLCQMADEIERLHEYVFTANDLLCDADGGKINESWHEQFARWQDDPRWVEPK